MKRGFVINVIKKMLEPVQVGHSGLFDLSALASWCRLHPGSVSDRAGHHFANMPDTGATSLLLLQISIASLERCIPIKD